MDSYVLDTHAWVWQLVYPAKLGKAALGVLQAADKGEVQVRIPAVVLAEFLMIAEKQRVPGLKRPVAESVIEQIRRHPGYVLTSLTPELVMASRLLKKPLQQPACITPEQKSGGARFSFADIAYTGR